MANSAKKIRNFLENLFEYYFVNINMNVNFFSDLKFEYYCEHYPEILLQVSFKYESKINWRCRELFLEKVTGPWNIEVYDLLGYDFFFEKFVKPSSRPFYILNVRSLIYDFKIFS